VDRIPDVAGIILAGGKSRRMGREKPLLELGGQPIISRVVGALKEAFAEVVVVTNKPAAYDWLGLPMIRDVVPDMGPLGGIHAGLLAITRPRAVVVAADMPFLQTCALHRLASLGDHHQMVIPYWRGYPEHLHALYPRTCLPQIEACLEAGERRIAVLTEQVPHLTIPAEKLTPFPHEVFFNMNTLEDYYRAKARLEAPLKKANPE
jgi:molybdopterin-guanine dinucleotide biosynthesis protein A